MKYIRTAILASIGVTAFTVSACGGAEARKERAMERGREYLTDENYEKARVEFGNVLQIDPNYADAVYLSGVAAEGLRDYRPAAQAYQSALNIDAMHGDARAALARLYLFSGLAMQALDMVAEGLAADPEHADLLTVRAAANVALGDEDTAFADAEYVVQAHPDHEQAVALLAGIYRNREEPQKGVDVVLTALELAPSSVDLRTVLAELYQSMGDTERAEAELQRIIELEPAQAQHRRRLAQFYLSTARKDEAEQVLRETLALEPNALEPKIALVSFLLAQESFDAAEAALEKFIAEDAEQYDLRLALGQFYESTNYFEEAEKVYRGMLDEAGLEPAGLQARNRLAAALLRSSRIDEAAALIDEVLDENPRDNDALLMRATIALAANRALDAITDLRSVLRDQPDSSTVLATLARAHTLNNEPDLARDNYRHALEVDPTNNATRLEYAQYLGRRGESDEAQVLLAAALQASPGDLPSLEMSFKVQLTARDNEKARATSDEIIALYPEHPLGYYLRGQLQELTGDTQAAIASYERSLEKAPRGAEPLGALTRVLVLGGQTPVAKQRLADVVAMFPDHSVALNLLAEIHVSERDFAPAADLADRAIQVAPSWWVLYRTKALALLGSGDVGAARAAYAAGLAATADSPALGMDLAALLERSNEPEEAISLYERLHGANPASELLANNLAMLLTTYRSDPPSFDRAYDLVRGFRNTDVPAFLNTYGWVRYKQGNLDEAVTYLRRAVAELPDNPTMRYHLGMALRDSGDLEAARIELATAVSAEQGFPGKDQAREALQALGGARS